MCAREFKVLKDINLGFTSPVHYFPSKIFLLHINTHNSVTSYIFTVSKFQANFDAYNTV